MRGEAPRLAALRRWSMTCIGPRQRCLLARPVRRTVPATWCRAVWNNLIVELEVELDRPATAPALWSVGDVDLMAATTETLARNAGLQIALRDDGWLRRNEPSSYVLNTISATRCAAITSTITTRSTGEPAPWRRHCLGARHRPLQAPDQQRRHRAGRLAAGTLWRDELTAPVTDDYRANGEPRTSAAQPNPLRWTTNHHRQLAAHRRPLAVQHRAQPGDAQL